MNDATPIVRKGRKFDQVLEGARDVFMADGFEGASVDDIARAAGVSAARLAQEFGCDRKTITRWRDRAETEITQKLNAQIKI